MALRACRGGHEECRHPARRQQSRPHGRRSLTSVTRTTGAGQEVAAPTEARWAGPRGPLWPSRQSLRADWSVPAPAGRSGRGWPSVPRTAARPSGSADRTVPNRPPPLPPSPVPLPRPASGRKNRRRPQPERPSHRGHRAHRGGQRHRRPGRPGQTEQQRAHQHSPGPGPKRRQHASRHARHARARPRPLTANPERRRPAVSLACDGGQTGQLPWAVTSDGGFLDLAPGGRF